MNKPYEILSPAGKPEAVLPLIQAGSDAIYVGLRGHSSRPADADFSIGEILSAVKICHTYGVRLHVAVNGCVGQGQIKDVLEDLLIIDRSDVDAVIISDPGILAAACQQMGNTAVHASTLMGIYNAASVQMLKELGVSRIVLSTNLYLDEMFDLISAVPDLEYEVVAGGGICMNDNRLCELPHEDVNGELKVFCRCRYRLESAKEAVKAPPISEKEVALFETAAQYLEMGVYSFKIEGRTTDYHFIQNKIKRLKHALEQAATLDYNRYSVSHYVKRFRR